MRRKGTITFTSGAYKEKGPCEMITSGDTIRLYVPWEGKNYNVLYSLGDFDWEITESNDNLTGWIRSEESGDPLFWLGVWNDPMDHYDIEIELDE